MTTLTNYKSYRDQLTLSLSSKGEVTVAPPELPDVVESG
jgi:hypothetical protein